MMNDYLHDRTDTPDVCYWSGIVADIFAHPLLGFGGANCFEEILEFQAALKEAALSRTGV